MHTAQRPATSEELAALARRIARLETPLPRSRQIYNVFLLLGSYLVLLPCVYGGLSFAILKKFVSETWAGTLGLIIGFTISFTQFWRGKAGWAHFIRPPASEALPRAKQDQADGAIERIELTVKRGFSYSWDEDCAPLLFLEDVNGKWIALGEDEDRDESKWGSIPEELWIDRWKWSQSWITQGGSEKSVQLGDLFDVDLEKLDIAPSSMAAIVLTNEQIERFKQLLIAVETAQ